MNYFEQMTLQERAEMEAAQLAHQIEHAHRICGLEMLNRALAGTGVQLVVKPLPVPPYTPTTAAELKALPF